VLAKTSFIIFFIVVFHSCKNKQRHNIATSTPNVVIILPYNDLDSNVINKTFMALKKQLPNMILHSPIELPVAAFYKPRNRYRADSLIQYQGKLMGADTVVLGMTSKDISTTKNDIKDWGVMGLGFCPGNACVVSSFRLLPKDRQAQFYKVAIHELGHTQGLSHCPTVSCFMRDAEGENPLNEETGFCTSCKTFLKNKGWLLN
jgi:archaemetzincin